MSSMRNAIQRRNHKERAQPLEREKWGLLEKHKDYSLRARDYGEKRARLKTLRQKAAERNPDEFNYGMLRSKSNKGRRFAERGNPSLGQDAVKLLKTQDFGYLRSTLQKTQKTIQRLEQEFVLVQGKGVNVLGGPGNSLHDKHVFFAHDTELQSGLGFRTNPEHTGYSQGPLASRERVGNDETDVGQEIVEPESHHQARQGALGVKEEEARRKRCRREAEAQKTKLAALKVRETELQDAIDELQDQRAKMNGTVGGVTKNGNKWKTRERKK